jgi:fatty acid desaturase
MNSASDSQQIQNIVIGIRAEEKRLRHKYSFLNKQDSIGFFILMLSLSGMITSAALFYYAFIPAWLCIIITAIFASISHELEHDLIHKLYFRNNAYMHNFMMTLVWLMRPSTINPWYRRKIHLLHHKTSGTAQDLEERLVGNGIANLFVRFIVMFDGLFGLLLQRKRLKREVKVFEFIGVLSAGFPLTILYYIFGYGFLLLHSINFFMPSGFDYPEGVMTFMELSKTLMVIIIAPNFLRSGCLNLVTSYLHYYGGVNSVLQQTQVFKGVFAWPLNLFTFNFAGTHAIHHFVIKQPFYIRQMVAKYAHKVMKENGVRFNDFSTFTQANRYRSLYQVD